VDFCGMANDKQMMPIGPILQILHFGKIFLVYLFLCICIFFYSVLDVLHLFLFSVVQVLLHCIAVIFIAQLRTGTNVICPKPQIHYKMVNKKYFSKMENLQNWAQHFKKNDSNAVQ
jgi:hypothetical protein